MPRIAPASPPPPAPAARHVSISICAALPCRNYPALSCSALSAAGSFAAGYLRVGLIVLWVHDVSDILVDILKLVNYLKLEDRRGLYASEGAYFICVLGWVYWRLYQFPATAIRAGLIESYRVLAPQPRTMADLVFGLAMRDLPLCFEMNLLLLTLLGLHVYWARLFFMIGYRILTGEARERGRAGRGEREGIGGVGRRRAVSSMHSYASASARYRQPPRGDFFAYLTRTRIERNNSISHVLTTF